MLAYERYPYPIGDSDGAEFKITANMSSFRLFSDFVAEMVISNFKRKAVASPNLDEFDPIGAFNFKILNYY